MFIEHLPASHKDSHVMHLARIQIKQYLIEVLMLQLVHSIEVWMWNSLNLC